MKKRRAQPAVSISIPLHDIQSKQCNKMINNRAVGYTESKEDRRRRKSGDLLDVCTVQHFTEN
jgi:hypothetical protein